MLRIVLQRLTRATAFQEHLVAASFAFGASSPSGAADVFLRCALMSGHAALQTSFFFSLLRFIGHLRIQLACYSDSATYENLPGGFSLVAWHVFFQPECI